MAKVIDYYFTPVSPFTYLGSQKLEEIASRHGVTIHYKPVDYGKIFPVSGGLPLAKRPPQRQAYRLFELRRWRRERNLPLNEHPKHFPVPADAAARLLIAARRLGLDVGKLSRALLRAVWAEERNIADIDTLKAIAAACGFDADQLWREAQRPETQAEYERDTNEAIERQVFGAPTYVYKDEPFWGQDRLELLEKALKER